MSFQRVKGAEDYFPKELAVREAIYKVLNDQACKFGFQKVDVPIMETMKLLTAKSGEEATKQIFVLEKRSAEELGLRFELTVGMVRMFVSKQKELAKPVKWFTTDKMWRYESPQKGRQREFAQLSIELFGSAKAEADALCINLIISCLKAFGLKNTDFSVKISNLKLLEGLLTEFVPKDKLDKTIRIIDKSSKTGPVEFVEELKKIGLDMQKIEVVKKIIACKGGPNILESIKKELNPNDLAKEGIKELENTLKYLDEKYIEIDLSIVRGLAYYTGTVYEAFDKERKYRSLAGGGRYDKLVELLGGRPEPATGMAMGMETLTLLLTDKKLLPKVEIGPEYYIAPVNEKMMSKAMEIAKKLRGKTTVDIDLMQRKLSKQFEYANTINAAKIVIVGEKDLKEGKVTVRDLKSGKEQQIPLDNL